MGELVERLISSKQAFVTGVNESDNVIRRHLGPAFLDELLEFVRTYPNDLVQPKLDKALQIAFQEVANGNKVLIFSLFNETTQYACKYAARLYEDTYFGNHLYLYDEKKGHTVNAESMSKFVGCTSGVLFCPGEMSEGVNLQFANVMINLDLPWDPMKIEQRIGRIQRLNSQFDKVLIYNLILTDTIEEDIIQILEQKLRMFEAVIGEVDEIVGSLSKAEDFRTMSFDLFMDQHQESLDGRQISEKEYIIEVIGNAEERAKQEGGLSRLFKSPEENM